MTFDIPNLADATFPEQARLYQSDLQMLTQTANLSGTKSGLAVTAQGSPNMTLAVAAGEIYWQNLVVAVTAGNVTITTAHATLKRIDLVCVNSSGTKSVVAGTAAAIPVEPAIPANSVVIAQVFVPAADTAIGSTQIKDRRIVVLIPSVLGSTTIVRKTAAETVASSTVFQDDNHLFFTLTPNGIWQVEVLAHATSASGAAMKFNFAGPTGATWKIIGSTNGPTVASLSESAATVLTTPGVSATPVVVLFKGVVTSAATSGDFRLQWAQNVSNASGHIVGINSYLEYRVLA